MTNTRRRIDLAAVMRSQYPRVGSVQTMYQVDIEGERGEFLLSEAPDKGSVFDIGTVFSVPGSGAQRQTLRHRIYTRLMCPTAWTELREADFTACIANKSRLEPLVDSVTYERLGKEGARTHHLGLVDRLTGAVITTEDDRVSDLVLMEGFPVVKPERADVAGMPVYDYSQYFSASTRLLALEHVVRLGNPGGSSLQSRYDRLARSSTEDADELLARFGLAAPLRPWSKLPYPVVEWSTKFEGYDRYLSTQEALLISGVDAAQLNELVDLLILCTVQVNSFVSRSGLHLWDLKWELAIRNGELVVVDTIDHDSMRLTYSLTHRKAGGCRVHFNKQSVRDYFKIFHPDWHSALSAAKRTSDQPGSQDFKAVYWAGVEAGQYPEPPTLDPEFADLQGRKYKSVTAGPEASEVEIRDLADQEIAYFSRRGQLETFLRFNAIAA